MVDLLFVVSCSLKVTRALCSQFFGIMPPSKKYIGKVVNEVCQRWTLGSKVGMCFGPGRPTGLLSLQFQSPRSFPNKIPGWRPGLLGSPLNNLLRRK